jgi:hypothetical protein
LALGQVPIKRILRRGGGSSLAKTHLQGDPKCLWSRGLLTLNYLMGFPQENPWWQKPMWWGERNRAKAIWRLTNSMQAEEYGMVESSAF